MAGNFYLTMDGNIRILSKLRGVEGMRDEIKDIVEGAAQRSAQTMQRHAPKGKTGGLYRRIGWTHARWHPGGAGGGGYWEADSGVGPGDPYPTHVFHGTGIYGESGEYIRARTGNVMVIDGFKPRDMIGGKASHIRPGPIFTKYIKGQKPQTDWVFFAQRSAHNYVGYHLANMLAKHRAEN